MTGPAPLSRVEALLLRHGTAGTWETRRLLTDHADAVASAKIGHGTGHLCAPGWERAWFQAGPKGIALHEDVGTLADESRAVHLLTWRRVREHAATVPAPLMADLRRVGADLLDHMASWRPARALGQAHHLGGSQGPLTLAQHQADAAYAHGQTRWWHEHDAEGRRLRALERDLVDAAVPLPDEAPVQREPQDLLELLAATT